MKAHVPELQEALDEFMKNELWHRVYANAPTGAKRYLELSFFASLDTDETGEVEEKWETYWEDKCEPLMTIEDYKYLADMATHPLEKKHLLEKAEKLAK